MIMIATKTDGAFITHYSDSGKKIVQVETGVEYDSATDVIPCQYTYEESENDVDAVELSDSDALKIITGVSV